MSVYTAEQKHKGPILSKSRREKTVSILEGLTYGQFLSLAPMWNPRSELITGSICGIKVEEIDDSMAKKMRQLDKLIDELATGKPMEKVLR